MATIEHVDIIPVVTDDYEAPQFEVLGSITELSDATGIVAQISIPIEP